MSKALPTTVKEIAASFSSRQIGAGLVFTACAFLVFIYWPVIATELSYHWLRSVPTQSSKIKTSRKQDWPSSFAIAINDINLIAPIVSQVNPYNRSEYQAALKNGVAHAVDAGLPDDDATMVLFAHSSGTIFDSNQASSQFLLLNKLSKDDRVTIFYQDQIYRYQVIEKKVVSPQAVQYLNPQQEIDLVLITCHPVGTRLKRLVVTAQQVADSN